MREINDSIKIWLIYSGFDINSISFPESLYPRCQGKRGNNELRRKFL